MDGVAANLWDSAFDFQRVVWPVVGPWMGGGELLPVEAVRDTELARALDLLAGIDAWRTVQGIGMQGIASRVQYGVAYETFTIRERRASGFATELQKRLAALEGQESLWAAPAWTVQAYVTRRRTGVLQLACMVRTRDLYRYVAANLDSLPRATNHADGSTFLIVPIASLDRAGVPVWSESYGGGSAVAADDVAVTWCSRCSVDVAYWAGLCEDCLEDIGVR